MKAPAESLIDLGRILERGGLGRFLEETARFYESGLVVLDKRACLVAEANRHAAPIFVERLPLTRREGEWICGSERIQPVEVLGSPVGFVATVPVRPEDESAARGLAMHVARLLSELAYREYELNDLSQEILDSYEEVNLFYDVSLAMGAVHSVEGICSLILGKACDIIKADRASILLLDERSEDLYLAAATGIPMEEWESVRIKAGEGISGKVLSSRTPQLVDDVDRLPGGLLAGFERYATRSFISVPLCVETGTSPGTAGLKVTEVGVESYLATPGNQAIGVINMTDRRDRRSFTSGDLKLLTALATQAAMIIENMRMVSVEKELRIARRIQKSLLPETAPRMPGLDLAGTCIPARKVGGDYYDFLCDPGSERLGLVVADVSGHNIASAIMMAVARSSLRRELRRNSGPGEVLYGLNAALYEDLTRAELFLSAVCALYETGTGRLRYANAGHHPPLLHRPGRGCRELVADGLLTGVLEETSYPEEEVDLLPGDVLVIYTDGIIEAVAPGGGMFGVERMAEVLERWGGESAERIQEEVLRAVHSFSGGAAQEDDMTLVVLKVEDPGRRYESRTTNLVKVTP